MPPTLRNFLRKQDGATTLEFVVVFVAFISIMFFVVEVTLYLFFMATLEKAAEAGVRVAVTSRPLVDFPRTIEPWSEADFGRSCVQGGGGPCKPFGDPDNPPSCTGDACETVSFQRILDHMRGFNGRIEASNVTITYADVGIGFAGGPTVPMVTVTVSCVPFQASILGFPLASAYDGCAEPGLPPRSASMTGEDLAQ